MKFGNFEDHGQGPYPVSIELELPEADIAGTAALFVAGNRDLLPEGLSEDADYIGGVGAALSQVVAGGAPRVEILGQVNVGLVGFVLRAAAANHPEAPIRALAQDAVGTYEREKLEAQFKYEFASGDVPDAPPPDLA